MIFSSIYANGYGMIGSAALQKALDYCAHTDFSSLTAGTYNLDGENMYAMIMDFTSKPLDNAHPERHEKYVDVQFWPEGEEYFGVAPYIDAGPLIRADQDKDIWLYESARNESFVHAVPGCYAVFFPGDLHRPGVCAGIPGHYRKVVVKINVDLL